VDLVVAVEVTDKIPEMEQALEVYLAGAARVVQTHPELHLPVQQQAVVAQLEFCGQQVQHTRLQI
jgi:hypothetical protein